MNAKSATVVQRLLEDDDFDPKEFIMSKAFRYLVSWTYPDGRKGYYRETLDSYWTLFRERADRFSLKDAKDVAEVVRRMEKQYKVTVSIESELAEAEDDDFDHKGYLMGLDGGVYGYEDIVSMQGSDADEALKIMDDNGKEAAIEYLAQWHNAGEHEIHKEQPWGTSDRVYKGSDGYVLTWNWGLNYISLCRIIREFSKEAQQLRDNEP